MVVQCHLLDVAAAPAVVVDDRHPVARLQHLLGFHAFGAVGVHHHQQCAGLTLKEGVRPGDGNAGVFRLLGKPPQDGMGGVVLGVDNDLAGLAPLAGDAADTHGSAQRVHVRVLVTHDVHLPGVVDQLAQGIGHDTGLNLGALLGALAAAAVELEVHAILHHGLISAAAERHLQRQRRVLEQLLEAVLVPSHADGQRGGHALAGLHLPHLFQHVELALGKAGVVLLLKQEQVPVAVVAQQQSAGARRPCVHLLLQRSQQRRALVFRAGLHQLLVVIHHQDGQQGLCQLQRLAHLLRLGDVHPVGGGQRGLLAALRLRAAQSAEHPVDAVVPAELLRILPLALYEPAVGEIGDHRVHRRLEYFLLLGGELHEHIVAPQDLAGGHVEHQHGQRRVQHVAGAGGVHTAGHPIHILPHGGLRHFRAAPPHQNDQHGHRRLRQRQQRLKGHGNGHERDQTQAVQRHVGAEPADDLFAHRLASFPKRG